jgi:hypothetical protein
MRKERNLMRKRISLLFAALMLALTMSFGGAAFADPAFGPGNKGGGEGNSGPQGAKCHPPGRRPPRPAVSSKQRAPRAIPRRRGIVH